MKNVFCVLAVIAAAIAISGAWAPGQEPPRPERKAIPKDSDDRIERPVRPSPAKPRPKEREDRLPGDRFRPFEGLPDRQPLPPPAAPGRDSDPFRPGSGFGRSESDRLRREDPEMFKLHEADRQYDRQTMDLAQRYRTATEAQREGIRKELADVVTKHFEVRQQRRELELKRMDEQLQRLREAIKKRQDSRQRIIDRRVSELVGSEGGLEF